MSHRLEPRLSGGAPPEARPEPPANQFVSVLDSIPGHLIRRLQQVAVSLFLEQSVGAGCDLTPVQYAALLAVRAYPGIDQASLAGVIAYDRTTIGGVLERLEWKGLLRRSSSANDRRLRQVSIEPAGADLLDAIAPAIDRAQANILDPLNREERAIFMLLLSKLVHANNERSRAPMRPVSGRARAPSLGAETAATRDGPETEQLTDQKS